MIAGRKIVTGLFKCVSNGGCSFWIQVSEYMFYFGNVIFRKGNFEISIVAILRWERFLMAINAQCKLKILGILQTIDKVRQETLCNQHLHITLPRSVHTL